MYYIHSTDNFGASKDQNELENMHLQKLLQDSLLEAESESLEPSKETVNKNKQTVNKNKPTAVKLPFNQKAQPMKYKVCSEGLNSNFKKVNSKVYPSTCCDNTLNKQHSTIHFLNHFDSTLKSSKALIQLRKSKNEIEQMPYAVPLSPPIQKDGHIIQKNLPKSKKEPLNIVNTGVYYLPSNEKTKNLAIQSLPSISICDAKCKTRKNVLVEEMIESGPLDDFVTTTLVPKKSLNVATSNHYENISNATSLKSINHHIPISTRSVITESIDSSQCAQNCFEKNLLKSLVKEVLNDLQDETNHKQILNREKTNSAEEVLDEFHHQKTSRNTKPSTDYRGSIKKVKFSQTEVLKQHSTYSQTDNCCSEDSEIKIQSLKGIIREVILEYKDFSTVMFDERIIQLNELRKVQETEKVDKDIQVNISDAKKRLQNTISSQERPETKDISPMQLNKTISQSEQNTRKEDSITKDFPLSNKETEINHRLDRVATKVDDMMNILKNHLLKTGNTGSENLNLNTIREFDRPIPTREVSLQFSPYMIAKCTYTSPTKTVDMANQCDLLRRPIQVVKRSLPTQTSPSLIKAMQTANKVDVFTECENLVKTMTDACIQTFELSPGTSASSTPVGDSSFYDDALSEGEIPWHLKFLSCHDSSAHQSSSNAGESSTASEEKDYSLSEGEIHPKYIQHYYNVNCSEDPTKIKKITLKDDFRELKTSSSFSLPKCTVPRNFLERSSTCVKSSSSLKCVALPADIQRSLTDLSIGEVPHIVLSPTLLQPSCSLKSDALPTDIQRSWTDLSSEEIPHIVPSSSLHQSVRPEATDGVRPKKACNDKLYQQFNNQNQCNCSASCQSSHYYSPPNFYHNANSSRNFLDYFYKNPLTTKKNVSSTNLPSFSNFHSSSICSEQRVKSPSSPVDFSSLSSIDSTSEFVDVNTDCLQSTPRESKNETQEKGVNFVK